MLDAADLPDDIAALKAMLIAAQAREVRMRRLCPIDFGFALELLRFRSFDE
ncbi:hypothetical protein HWD97_11365 [Ochrobactrum sp. C6C9]|uniref:hypothetical protein n=1 Tax=Ochrobactrum sp. C6C9 TaxID=2736662 RepID=UPI003530077F|nr:hypothetical protein [Ochrobactrum sp. C6C9]